VTNYRWDGKAWEDGDEEEPLVFSVYRTKARGKLSVKVVRLSKAPKKRDGQLLGADAVLADSLAHQEAESDDEEASDEEDGATGASSKPVDGKKTNRKAGAEKQSKDKTGVQATRTSERLTRSKAIVSSAETKARGDMADPTTQDTQNTLSGVNNATAQAAPGNNLQQGHGRLKLKFFRQNGVLKGHGSFTAPSGQFNQANKDIVAQASSTISIPQTKTGPQKRKRSDTMVDNSKTNIAASTTRNHRPGLIPRVQRLAPQQVTTPEKGGDKKRKRGGGEEEDYIGASHGKRSRK
jgi:hypothetical protein